jgi:hypothetical protein
MGIETSLECSNCHSVFTYCDGGGFDFHLLHCDRCGKEKLVNYSKLREIHWKYFRDRNPVYAAADLFYLHYPPNGQPKPNRDLYWREIEDVAGNCRCGGQYREAAPRRCPKCKSTNVQEIEFVGARLYD